MGVGLIKCVWLKFFARTPRALMLQPHHSKNPRSTPAGHLNNNIIIVLMILVHHEELLYNDSI